MKIEKYIKDGKVGVLISKGYGAGWYTWNTEYPAMLFDKRLIEIVLDGRAYELEERTVSKIIGAKPDDIYTGGNDGLTVEWIDEGAKFRVTEYDGVEGIEVIDELDYLIA